MWSCGTTGREEGPDDATAAAADGGGGGGCCSVFRCMPLHAVPFSARQ